MSFSSMHNDYLDPDRHLGGGGAADEKANADCEPTPGPWAWDYSVSVKAGDTLVALVYNPQGNGALVAAAPKH